MYTYITKISLHGTVGPESGTRLPPCLGIRTHSKKNAIILSCDDTFRILRIPLSRGFESFRLQAPINI